MAYTATKTSNGLYEVSLNGQRVATGTADILPTYSLSESQLIGQNPFGTGPQSNGGSINDPFAKGTSIAYGNTTQPASQTPLSPTPQISTPAVPAAAQPTATAMPSPGIQEAVATPTSPTQQRSGITMPPTGSVVDLLNMAGQESSYAARKQLAQQYGIQGYTGTAAQNQELSKKFIEAYNATKSTPVPQSNAEARAAMTSLMEGAAETQRQDPERSFFDEYMTMNPVLKNLYDQVN